MGVFELERIHTLHGLALHGLALHGLASHGLGPGQALNDVYAD